jgi:hypothetical protein
MSTPVRRVAGLVAAVMSTFCAQAIICHQQSGSGWPSEQQDQRSVPVAGKLACVSLLPLTVAGGAVWCKPR